MGYEMSQQQKKKKKDLIFITMWTWNNYDKDSISNP